MKARPKVLAATIEDFDISWCPDEFDMERGKIGRDW